MLGVSEARLCLLVALSHIWVPAGFSVGYRIYILCCTPLLAAAVRRLLPAPRLLPASFCGSFPCCVSIGTCKSIWPPSTLAFLAASALAGVSLFFFFASPGRLLVVISYVMIVMHLGSSAPLHMFTRACASTPC